MTLLEALERVYDLGAQNSIAHYDTDFDTPLKIKEEDEQAFDKVFQLIELLSDFPPGCKNIKVLIKLFQLINLKKEYTHDL